MLNMGISHHAATIFSQVFEARSVSEELEKIETPLFASSELGYTVSNLEVEFPNQSADLKAVAFKAANGCSSICFLGSPRSRQSPKNLIES